MKILDNLRKLFLRKKTQTLNKLLKLEELLGYSFSNKNILNRALMHRSYVNFMKLERHNSNENLEFLGDAVLGLIISEFLYYKYPERKEGELSRIKALVVSEKVLSEASKSLNLGEYIYFSKNEKKMGGEGRTSILADTFEAVLGAIYVDGGILQAKKFVDKTILRNIDKILLEKDNRNFKSILQEVVQAKYKVHPQYVVVDEQGPEHNKVFFVNVLVNNEVWGEGKGTSKKDAEQVAAENAINNKIKKSNELLYRDASNGEK